jgi:hypothetical protein
MKIIKKKRKKKSKIPFRRSSRLYYKDDWKTKEMIRALCFFWDEFNYSEFKNHVAHVLHTRKESKLKKLPIIIIGDAKHPPMPFKVDRYYLTYNPNNFIGEYAMGLYDDNTFLIFHLLYPEDFDKYKEVAHRTVYLGSPCKITFVCSNDAVLSNKKIKKEDISDYDVVIMKDSYNYTLHHKTSKSFEFWVPKNT